MIELLELKTGFETFDRPLGTRLRQKDSNVVSSSIYSITQHKEALCSDHAGVYSPRIV